MNELKEVVDRVGARFDRPARFEDLSRRRNRVRARRRIAAGAFALAIAAGGSLMTIRAFRPSAQGSPSRVKVAATWPGSPSATSAGMAAHSPCPMPSGDSPPSVVLSPTSGAAGSSVEVSGTFQTGELWFQLWWNTDGDRIPRRVAPPPWPPTGPSLHLGPVGPGPVTRLASVARPPTGECSFRTGFAVPAVDPGTYEVLFAFGVASPPTVEGGYALFAGTISFQVTR